MAATQRQRDAIGSHDRSTIVTAGAGTGKTYVLVQKYIDLLETRNVPVPQILALTFTDKAAAEMKERIRREIGKRAGPEWEKAANDFMIAPVQTFHAFCAQVLREFPIEAGLEPGFIILDERQMARIYATAFDELMHVPQDGPVQAATVYVLAVTDQKTLNRTLAAMYAKRREYLRFFDTLESDPGGIIRYWTEEVHRFRDTEIRSLVSDRGFIRVIETLLSLADRYTGSEDKAILKLAEILPQIRLLAPESSLEEFCSAASAVRDFRMGNVGSKKNFSGNDLETIKQSWRSLSVVLDQKAQLFGLTLNPADPRISTSIRFLLELGLVFRRYISILSQEKAALGGLDFSDLILHARRMFTEHPGLVATHFADRFRYILVDEFQDTDPAQFEIVLALVGDLTPKTDCLFIVGDPKQSIYLFREADVTRFKEAQKIVEKACCGLTVNLDTSFRSTKEVIGLANSLFASLFASAEKAFEFGYEPVKVSDARADHSGSVELLLPARGETSTSTKHTEAEMVARRIHALVNGSPVEVYEELPEHQWKKRQARYGDIAILLEQRTNLSYYLSSLSRAGIPYYVHGGTGFYGRQEIFDLHNLLSFLEYPHDDVSLFGVLRSPYFGMSDAELFFLTRLKGRTVYEKLLNADESPASARAKILLNKWRGYAGRIRPVSLIRKILGESGIYTVYGALPEGRQVLANIEKLVAIVRSRESGQEGYSLADLVSDLRLAMDEEEREGEAPLDALAENAVNVMTVHAAKGLEFPIVVVPDMGVSFRERYPAIIMGDDYRFVGVKIPDPEDNFMPADTPILAALREMQKQKERAERKRLLYVALTRARDHLIMSGSRPEEMQPFEFAKTRIEWVFSSLGITNESVEDGYHNVNGVRLQIVSNPHSIPAEFAEMKPSLIDVPWDCIGKNGSWNAPIFISSGDQNRPRSVSELEEWAGIRHPEGTPGVSIYMPGVEGTKKGIIIHEILRGRDAATVLREYREYSEENLRQCEKIFDMFYSTDLIKGVKRSFCEVPFIVTIDGQRVKGRIDRLCEMQEGGWLIIDYKSESLSPKDEAIVTEKFTDSMTLYLKAVHLLLQQKNIKMFLYFTESEIFLEISNI